MVISATNVDITVWRSMCNGGKKTGYDYIHMTNVCGQAMLLLIWLKFIDTIGKTFLSTACYEVFCEKGDGYQPSVCGNGCNGYVKCEGGFAVINRRCPRRRPYFCCHTRVCVTSVRVCGGRGRCPCGRPL